MKFFYRGAKKSNEPDVASGCLLIIGFGAIIYLITLLEDLDDWQEYGWQIALAFLIGGSFIASMFAKKAKLTNRHIVIENDYLKMEKIGVPLNNLVMDIYSNNGNFKRYHLRDQEGKVTIYSVLEDDLLLHFQENLSSQVNIVEENSSKHEGPYISVKGKNQSLYYNLESGKYTLTQKDQPEISFLPEIFAYDGKYKKGVPLLKKKS
jgi:hypothetical protein